MNRIVLFFVFVLNFVNLIAAAPPGNGESSQDATSLPISGGLIYLLAGAILLGVKKIIRKKRQ